VGVGIFNLSRTKTITIHSAPSDFNHTVEVTQDGEGLRSLVLGSKVQGCVQLLPINTPATTSTPTIPATPTPAPASTTTTTTTTAASKTREIHVDYNYVAFGYLRAMLLGLAFKEIITPAQPSTASSSPTAATASSTVNLAPAPLRSLHIGLGPGVLPMFLDTHFPASSVSTVVRDAKHLPHPSHLPPPTLPPPLPPPLPLLFNFIRCLGRD
jgi:hypothetical protein